MILESGIFCIDFADLSEVLFILFRKKRRE